VYVLTCAQDAGRIHNLLALIKQAGMGDVRDCVVMEAHEALLIMRVMEICKDAAEGRDAKALQVIKMFYVFRLLQRCSSVH
jgi:hypothetical protein